MNNIDTMSVEELTINTIRTLAIDAVQEANSGHPGAPMALAPLAYVVWTKFLNYNPADPDWFNRDRFILSNGHASALLYAMIHLAGFDLSLEEVKNFRQWGSKTPGHPEYGLTPGVETTTGPLGQGLTNAVGMAIAEAHLASIYNKPGFDIIDHHTFVFCGDGDLMEGVSHEACSLAGHLGLGKLICFYDDNHITIEGKTELAYSDDATKRFEAYGWHVINIGDNANNLEVISDVIGKAKGVKDKPSMIIVRSHIGYGSPNMQDTSTVHGAPLGEEELKLTKKAYGWPEEKKFFVPEKVREHMATFADEGKQRQKTWKSLLAGYKKEFPEMAARLLTSIKGQLPEGWEKKIPAFKPADGPVATRAVGGTVLNAIAAEIPWLVGGSADLSPSTKTLIKGSDYMAQKQYSHRNIAWGVREFGMCAALSGMVVHGGIRSFGSTFFVFTDYARPAIRLAALMHLPVIYIMTHDSIGVGEDGPTHQPVEHLASFRLIPGVCVIRPADANETAQAWKAALLRTDGPTMIVLTRQGLPVLDQEKFGSAEGVLKGAYVLHKEKGEKPDLILIATGSEVQLVLEAQKTLADDGIDARVVSMPSWELFENQPQAYQRSVLPADITARLGVEAGSSFGWGKWVGEKGAMIAIDKFGASAPAKNVFENYGITVEKVVEKAREILGG